MRKIYKRKYLANSVWLMYRCRTSTCPVLAITRTVLILVGWMNGPINLSELTVWMLDVDQSRRCWCCSSYSSWWAEGRHRQTNKHIHNDTHIVHIQTQLEQRQGTSSSHKPKHASIIPRTISVISSFTIDTYSNCSRCYNVSKKNLLRLTKMESY